MVIKLYTCELCHVVLWYVVCSYIDIKQIEAACLLFVKRLSALHYVVCSLHLKPFIML